MVRKQCNGKELLVQVTGKKPLSHWYDEVGDLPQAKHQIEADHQRDQELGAYSIHPLNGGNLVLSANNQKGLTRLQAYALHALHCYYTGIPTSHNGLVVELVRWFKHYKLIVV